MSETGTLDERLRFAITHKRLVQVTYHGRSRTGEPHDYGRQHGVAKLLFYQRRETGGARRENVQGWRLLEMSKIEACVVLTDTFGGSRGGAHSQHLRWGELFARVG